MRLCPRAVVLRPAVDSAGLDRALCRHGHVGLGRSSRRCPGGHAAELRRAVPLRHEGAREDCGLPMPAPPGAGAVLRRHLIGESGSWRGHGPGIGSAARVHRLGHLWMWWH